MQKVLKNELPSFIYDSLWLIGQEIDPTLGYSGEKKDLQLIKLIQEIKRSRLCTVYDLNCHLEVETLKNTGLIGKDFNKLMIRIYTRRHYTQLKFNLMRDENEGYAKLISFLHQSSINEETLKESLSSYIGTFNLDPNRVFDVILDACEFESSKYPIYKRIFADFKVEEIPNYIEFKFMYYKSQKEKQIPQSLLEFTILLINDGFITLDFIKKVLSDEEEAMSKFAQERNDTLFKYIASMQRLNKDLADSPSQIVNFPKHFNLVNLLIAAASHSSLAVVLDLWKYIKETGLNPCWSKQCCKALSHILTDISCKVYSEITSYHHLTKQKCRELQPEDKITTIEALMNLLRDPVLLMGPFIIYDPYFYTILCRLCAYSLQHSESLTSIVKLIYKNVLIPSLSMSTPNCYINTEIWEGLRLLNQSERFNIYTYWQDKELTENADLLFGMKKNFLTIDYYFRRIDLSNVKEMSRILIYSSYATPLYFFRSLVYKCTTFDNFIKFIIPQLKLITSIGIDVCIFCIIEALEDRKQIIEDDGFTIEKGFSLIIDFTSSFVNLLTTRVDLTLLMRYVEKRLRAGDITIIMLISKLISDVANIPSPLQIVTPSLSMNVIRCLSSSLTLIGYTQRYRKVTISNDSRDYILKTLTCPEIIQSTLLYYPRLVAELVYEKEYTDLNILSLLYDRNRDIFYHELMLLQHHKDYIQLLRESVKSPEMLFIDYHLEIPFAFALLRSMICVEDEVRYLVNPTEVQPSSSLVNLVTPAFERAIKSYYSPTVWNVLDYKAFVLFWLIQYSDLSNSKECYDEYKSVINNNIKQKKQEKSNSRSERSIQKQIEVLRKELEMVENDANIALNHKDQMESLLKSSFSSFFCDSNVDTCMVQFIQSCLIPRILSSSMDALFCAQFIRSLIQWQTPNYNHLLFVRRALPLLLSLLRSITENEALNVSIFLLEIFTDLLKWNKSEDEYKQNCMNNICFAEDYTKPKDACVSYKSFLKMYKHWMKLITVIIVSDLQSSDLLHVRNALDFLQRMNDVYPQKSEYADALYPYLENLMFMDNGGIRTSAQMLCTNLKN